MEHVILMGASGHAKVVIDILHEMSCREGIEYNIELLDDDASLQGTKIMGHKVVGKISDCVNYPKSRFLISIGNNKIRETLAKRYQLDYMTAIHPSAIIGTDVAVGEGTVIMAGAVINCGTKIGTHCIVNTGATLDHDNKISDFVHISPGVHLAGAVSVGEKSWIGVGSCCVNNISIGAEILVGGGSTVIGDLTAKGTYVGTPAKRLKK